MVKNFLTTFILLTVFPGVLHPAWSSNWAFRQAITNNYAAGNDLTNFPLLLVISNHQYFRYYYSNNTYKMMFTLVDGITRLDHEVEYFDQYSGTLIAWIRMPLLDSAEVNSNII